ncbi:hypothetical protein PENTCL1PPCAC_30854 [Pristionchus entomophagus]|uniref:Uncharacterized protein n=1 Tax=Pristionchus entomophagus TaxID=358040 RepID=A0AAV5UR14_9BILA|nr:hypothetical protein PENTCL1PPCAC_30854 [Pristionchus entomophagus]
MRRGNQSIIDRAMDPNKRPQMIHFAKEFNVRLKDSTSSSSGSTYGPKEMTLNKINGVSRTAFFDHTNTIEFDESNSTLENDSFDKVEKSGGTPKPRRTQGSKGGEERLVSSRV